MSKEKKSVTIREPGKKVIVSGLGMLFLIWLAAFINGTFSSDESTELRGSFKVVILPFEDISKSDSVDYASLLRSRLEHLNNKDTLDIDIQYLKSFRPQERFGSLEWNELLTKYNADLLIWGNHSIDSNSGLLSLQYYSRKWKQFNQTDPKLTAVSIQDFSQGSMQGDIDYILYYINGIINYNESKAREPKLVTSVGNKFLFDPGNLDSRRVWKAIKSFEYTLSDTNGTLQPEDSIYAFLGLCYLSLNNSANAASYFEKYLKEVPTDPYAWANLALALSLNKNWQGSIHAISKSIQFSPLNHGFIYNRSTFYFANNSIDSATIDLWSVIKLDRNYFPAYYLMATIYTETNPDSALFYIDKSISLNRDFSYLHDQKAEILRNQNDLDNAITEHGIAIRLDSTIFSFYTNRALTYSKKIMSDSARKDHWYKAANDDIKKASELAENSSQLLQASGRIKLSNKDCDGAIRDFTKAIELSKDKYSGYRERYTIYLQCNKFDECVSDATEMIKLRPNKPDGYIDRGMALIFQGKYLNMKNKIKQGILDLDKAIELNSSTYWFFSNRAIGYAFAGNKAKSLRDLETARKMKPGLSDSSYNDFVNKYDLK